MTLREALSKAKFIWGDNVSIEEQECLGNAAQKSKTIFVHTQNGGVHLVGCVRHWNNEEVTWEEVFEIADKESKYIPTETEAPVDIHHS